MIRALLRTILDPDVVIKTINHLIGNKELHGANPQWQYTLYSHCPALIANPFSSVNVILIEAKSLWNARNC